MRKFDFAVARRALLVAIPITFCALMLGSLGGGLSDNEHKIYTIDNLLATTSGISFLVAVFLGILGFSPLKSFSIFRAIYVIIVVLIWINLLFALSTIPLYDFYNDLLGVPKYF